MLHAVKLEAQPGGGNARTKIKRAIATMARAAVEPNGFWKSLALGLAALVVAMLGWFLVDQAQQGRSFRQESRATWLAVERRLNRIETRLEADDRDTER